jgi:CBS domain-containing protein
MAYIQVSEIMTRKPITVKSSMSIMESAKVMKAYKISSVLVMSGKKLVGILTVDDVVRLAVASGMDLEKTIIEDIMTRDVVTISPDKDITDVMNMFAEFEIHQVPVIDGKNLAGFVTLKDVLRFEPAMLDIAVGGLRLEEENRQRILLKRAAGEIQVDEDDEDLFE